MKTEASRLILAARRSAGLSQTELAARAGIPHSVLSAYERGRRDPSSRALAHVLSAAGYRLSVSPAGPDPERAGRRLADVLRLADAIPTRDRGELRYPGLA